jgi:hypothetical protein
MFPLSWLISAGLGMVNTPPMGFTHWAIEVNQHTAMNENLTHSFLF